jgi:ABC-type uncharacterized transport system permease subunit
MIVFVFLAATLRIAIPYIFAATGGVISERSGLIALGLEGYMLAGAFCAALASYYSGSPWIGLLGAMAGGMAIALLYAVTVIRYRADQVVVGIAINLLLIGVTRFFLRLAFHSTAQSPRVPGFGAEQSGTGVAALASSPLIWVGVLSVAAMAVGIRVGRIRYVSATISGMLAGLGGAYLALDQHQFSSGMTAGRGFIALAAVIFGRWDPVRAALACLLFAAAETLQIQLQGAQLIPSQFVEMIPYLLTIIALAGVVVRATPPAALGKVSE